LEAGPRRDHQVCSRASQRYGHSCTNVSNERFANAPTIHAGQGKTHLCPRECRDEFHFKKFRTTRHCGKHRSPQRSIEWRSYNAYHSNNVSSWWKFFEVEFI